MTSGRLLALPVMALALALAPSTTASAQTGASGAGPMIVEQVHSGFLFSPEVKFTTVDHHASTLVGGHAGWLVDEHIFLGAGGYWLANDSSDRRMSYGGLDAGFQGGTDQRVAWSLKALFGGGRATLRDTVTLLTFSSDPAANRVRGFPYGEPTGTMTASVRVRQDFFVVEPQASASVRLSRHARLVGGVGYRAVSADRRDGGRLSGAVANIGIQFGVGR